ncbi:MAG: ATP:cob(I)alamin adenosyltransferase [Desulfobacterales bacterium]
MTAWARHCRPLKSLYPARRRDVVCLGAYCRTVCRRAERRIISLSLSARRDRTGENAGISTDLSDYVSRLSDYLFV